MLIFTKPRYIQRSRATNWYDYDTRDGLCSECGETIGTQSNYNRDGKFFWDNREIENYKFCPYCGQSFKKEVH